MTEVADSRPPSWVIRNRARSPVPATAHDF